MLPSSGQPQLSLGLLLGVGAIKADLILKNTCRLNPRFRKDGLGGIRSPVATGGP